MVVKSYNLVEKVFLFSCSIYLIGSNWEFLEVNCMKVIKNHIFSIIFWLYDIVFFQHLPMTHIT